MKRISLCLRFLALGFATVFCLQGLRPAHAAEVGRPEILQLLGEDPAARKSASRKILKSKDRSLIPWLVDGAFFARREARPEVFAVLSELAGEQLPDDYQAWVEYVGARQDLVPKPGYRAFKASLFSRIDLYFADFLHADQPLTIRPEEIVWGGVRRDGIPSLDDPPTVAAAEATYLRDDETVFGVSLGGQQRAYPERFLSWHEMANDEVGGVPITLSFCTLCGSAILYDTRLPEGGARRFGTSGLLYRSNKLMYDRATSSLWSNLTGAPVVGPLVGKAPPLAMLPLTRTTWSDWKTRHPGTRVLALAQPAGRGPGYRYEPGAAEAARQGVRFPVWQQSSRLPRDTEVFALVAGGSARAYPVATVLERRVINDVLGDIPLLLVGDRAAGAVRAYRRENRTFKAGESPLSVISEDGMVFRVEEEALAAMRDGDELRLPRLPGHISFWFGWYTFYPQTSVYEPPAL